MCMIIWCSIPMVSNVGKEIYAPPMVTMTPSDMITLA